MILISFFFFFLQPWLCFVMCKWSTTPEFQGAVGGIGLDDHPMTTTTAKPEGNATVHDDHHSVSVVIDVIVWIDAFTAIFFTIEYVVRFACSPRKLRYKNFLYLLIKMGTFNHQSISE